MRVVIWFTCHKSSHCVCWRGGGINEVLASVRSPLTRHSTAEGRSYRLLRLSGSPATGAKNTRLSLHMCHLGCTPSLPPQPPNYCQPLKGVMGTSCWLTRLLAPTLTPRFQRGTRSGVWSGARHVSDAAETWLLSEQIFVGSSGGVSGCRWVLQICVYQAWRARHTWTHPNAAGFGARTHVRITWGCAAASRLSESYRFPPTGWFSVRPVALRCWALTTGLIK